MGRGAHMTIMCRDPGSIQIEQCTDPDRLASLARCLGKCKSTPDLSFTAVSLLTKVGGCGGTRRDGAAVRVPTRVWNIGYCTQECSWIERGTDYVLRVVAAPVVAAWLLSLNLYLLVRKKEFSTVSTDDISYDTSIKVSVVCIRFAFSVWMFHPKKKTCLPRGTCLMLYVSYE